MMKNAAARTPCLHLSIVAGVVVTLLMTIYASTGGLFPGDTTIARAVQAVDASGVGAMVRLLNGVFHAPVLIGITIALSIFLGILGYIPQMFLLAATSLAQVTNAALKTMVGRPRPEDGHVQVTEQASGLSFPSGHTMGTVVFCGVIIYLSYQLISNRYLRLAVQALAITQMFAIGFSRVYTGAHWPSDVVGGFLWGAWFVVFLVVCYRRLYTRFVPEPAIA